MRASDCSGTGGSEGRRKGKQCEYFFVNGKQAVGLRLAIEAAVQVAASGARNEQWKWILKERGSAVGVATVNLRNQKILPLCPVPPPIPHPPFSAPVFSANCSARPLSPDALLPSITPLLGINKAGAAYRGLGLCFGSERTQVQMAVMPPLIPSLPQCCRAVALRRTTKAHNCRVQ
ncbi:hypothetical protein BDZ91DRAFT_840759 [Kalaharituber pfeilii]|nr:hypothetical protein BDZ91DRAFT_840759 [Kalaharituber pfeilii]